MQRLKGDIKQDFKIPVF